jgi:cytochrome c553
MKISTTFLCASALLGFGFSPMNLVADDAVGKSIYSHCKSCHGDQGIGGKGGKYPRIAGLPEAYVAKQLSDFKQRKRSNKPMLPIFSNWRFDQQAIEAVSVYVAQMPEADVNVLGYEPSSALLASFDSREEFEQLGLELFEGTCAQCHGDDGRGRADKDSPPLVNQYPEYIKRQIGDFANGRREHEHAAKMFGELDEEEVESLLVYLTKLGQS